MIKNMKICGGLLAFALALPNFSQAKSLEELLVEKGVITQGEQAAVDNSGESARVYYEDGTRIDFPDSNGFSLKIRTMLQARYSFQDNDEDFAADPSRHPVVNYNGVNGTRVNTSGFDVIRARLVVEGTALWQEFAYKLEGDFVGTTNNGNYDRDLNDGRSEPDLKDAYIRWQPCEGWGTQIGQFRTFVSRQFRTNDAYLQFADRSIASEVNFMGWQQGVSQHLTSDDGTVEFAVGLFNGSSDNEGRNGYVEDTDHAGMATLRFNPIGDMGSLFDGTFTEGDIDNSQDAALSLGATYSYDEGHNLIRQVTGQEDTVSQRANADINFKAQGFSLHGEYFYKQAETQHSDNLDYALNGGYIQAGLFVEPSTVELAARYSYQDCDNGQAPGLCYGNKALQEAAATVNYYMWNHSLKAQLGYGYLTEEHLSDENANSNKWTFQVSSYF